jgi:hypothetical protein
MAESLCQVGRGVCIRVAGLSQQCGMAGSKECLTAGIKNPGVKAGRGEGVLCGLATTSHDHVKTR